VLTVEHPTGVLRSMTLIQFNAWYRFTDVVFSHANAARYYEDPTCLVLSLSLSVLLQSFRYFSARDMRVLGRSHDENCDWMAKAQIMARLEKHACSEGCSEFFYVFKCLPQERRYALSRLGQFLTVESAGDPLLISGASSSVLEAVDQPGQCYDQDNRLKSKTSSIVRGVGSGLYLNKQSASDEVLSVLE